MRPLVIALVALGVLSLVRAAGAATMRQALRARSRLVVRIIRPALRRGQSTHRDRAARDVDHARQADIVSAPLQHRLPKGDASDRLNRGGCAERPRRRDHHGAQWRVARLLCRRHRRRLGVGRSSRGRVRLRAATAELKRLASYLSLRRRLSTSARTRHCSRRTIERTAATRSPTGYLIERQRER